MAKLGPKWYINDQNEDRTLLHRHPASKAIANMVINTEQVTLDGRSEWLWIRLSNGDLILGCYPQGETYMACEEDAQMP